MVGCGGGEQYCNWGHGYREGDHERALLHVACSHSVHNVTVT